MQKNRKIVRPLIFSSFAAIVIGLTVAAMAWPLGESSESTERVAMAGRLSASIHLTGSGFSVAPGYIVTNAHVTMQCRAQGLPVLVGGSDGWRVVQEDPTQELALLEGPAANAPRPVQLSAAPSLGRGTKVLLLGYPMNRWGGADRLEAEQGSVERAALTVHQPAAGRSVSFYLTGADGKSTDPTWQDGVTYFGSQNANNLRWILDIAATSVHGESGGPVVDMAGNVVGVIFAGSRQAGETSAVTLSDLRDFLLRANIMPAFAPPPELSDNWRSAVDRVAGSVARVSC